MERDLANSDQAQYPPGSINAVSPAKINLHLELTGKRPDGFHSILTLMLPISVADELTAQVRGNDVTLSIWQRLNFSHQTDAISQIPNDDQNLIVKVIKEFRRECGIRQGIHFDLNKFIPAGGGLGGASSNAATALKLANQLWQTGWNASSLADFGARFGSDIAFFFQNRSAAICSGKGEQIRSLDLSLNLFMLLLRPRFGLSTAEVYSQVVLADLPTPEQSALHLQYIESQLTDGNIYAALQACSNRLERPAIAVNPKLSAIFGVLELTGPLVIQLSGSGSCVYGLYRNRRQVAAAAARVRALNLGETFIGRAIRSH